MRPTSMLRVISDLHSLRQMNESAIHSTISWFVPNATVSLELWSLSNP